MNRKIGFLCVAAASLMLLGGCGQKKEGADRRGPVPVRVFTVEHTGGTESDVYVGTVQPSKSAVLSCRYPGTLVALHVSEGDRVCKGDTVAVIDSRAVRSSWEMAHASLRQAEDGYRRLVQVHDSGSVADVKMIEIETELTKARASAEAADKALEDCVVKAPFDGVIGDVFTEEGVDVSSVEPLARILDISGLEIEISVPEGEIGQMEEGALAEVSVPALDYAGFPASLRTKGIVASALSHSYKCTLVPSARVEGLMPGMVCKVTFSGTEDALVIPAAVVRTDKDGRYVWIVEDGKVRKRHVAPGGFSGKGVIITDGLVSGDRVICEGMQKVSSGMTVSVK